MKAGKTDFEVGTRVRITRVIGTDADDKALVGATGEITHPFPGLMLGRPSQYIAGIYLDDEHRTKGTGLPLGHSVVNLIYGDEVEAI